MSEGQKARNAFPIGRDRIGQQDIRPWPIGGPNP